MNEIAATSEFDIGIDKNYCVLMDLKGMFNRKEAENAGFVYWRL
jgi:UDP-N-acetyl-D-galactosamine dehydrogenase